jgi:hypothetical protein
MCASDLLRTYRGSASLCEVPGGFTPLSLPGLMLWLRADQGLITTLPNAGKVVSWADQSGQGHDFVQGSDAQRPAYNAANANFANQPTVDFAGGQTLTCSMPGGQVAITFLYCYRPVTAIASRPMITQGLVARSFYAAGDAIICSGAAGFDQVAFTSPDLVNTKYRKAGRFPFSTLTTVQPDAMQNAVAQGGTLTSNTGTNTTLNALTWTLGSTVLAAVSEIIACEGLLTDAQIQAVDAYQLARFG